MTTQIEIKEVTPLSSVTKVVVAEGLKLTQLFTAMADTPSDYSGQGGKSVKVKSTEDGLEFVDDEAWKPSVRTQAQMEEMIRSNTDKYAASGFVHYGKTRNVVGFEKVNEGMYTYDIANVTTYINRIVMGRVGSDAIGESKTDLPRTAIAGFISDLYGFGRSSSATAQSEVLLPEETKGYDIYDSSGDARGTGSSTLNLRTEVDPKYGTIASTDNDAVARAFEAEVLNGDFRYGDNGLWLTSGTASISNGFATVPASSSVFQGTGRLVTNEEYEVQVVVENVVGSGIGFRHTTDRFDFVGLENGLNTFRFTHLSTDINPRFQITTGSGESCTVTYVSVRPITEEVVTERVDVFGGEFFLEEITDNNDDVYPYGIIQSKLAGTVDGAPLSTGSRLTTYYAVYDGDTSSVGNSWKWSTLTDSQKAQIASNEANNLFILDDGRLIQWRCRVRSFAGGGNGDWSNIDPTGLDSTQQYLCYDDYYRVIPQGAQDRVDAPKFGSDNYLNEAATVAALAEHQKGVFVLRDTPNNQNASINGLGYFHVWGQVTRLNTGAYHPSLNEQGAGRWGGDGDLNYNYEWYARGTYDSAGLTATTTSECWSLKSTNIAGDGSLGNSSGRGDGHFYDAIYASGQANGVSDDRLSAEDISSPEEAAKIDAKAKNGTYRGKERLVRMREAEVFNYNPSNPVVAGLRWSDTKLTITWDELGNGVFRKHWGAQGNATQGQTASNPLYRDLGFVCANAALKGGISSDDINSAVYVYQTDATLGEKVLVPFVTDLSAEGDFLCRDVIGDPANILQVQALSRGWYGYWCPVIPDVGTIDYPMTRKSLVTTGRRTYTNDLGSSWTNQTAAIDAVGNFHSTSALNGAVTIIEYTAAAYVTEQDENRPVLNAEKGLGSVFAYCDTTTGKGNLFAESLLNKVVTSAVGGVRYEYLPLTKHSLVNDNELQDSTWSGSTIHNPLNLATPANDSPAVKALMYQTAENQGLYLNYAYNESVYNASPTFTVIDMTTSMSGVVFGGLYQMSNSEEFNGYWIVRRNNITSQTFQQRWDDNSLTRDTNGNVIWASDNTVVLEKIAPEGWGDDSTIKIADGQTTDTNLNGDTILVGTNRLSKRYGYSRNQARAGTQTPGVDL